METMQKEQLNHSDPNRRIHFLLYHLYDLNNHDSNGKL